jgi:hypothetical protein
MLRNLADIAFLQCYHYQRDMLARLARWNLERGMEKGGEEKRKKLIRFLNSNDANNNRSEPDDHDTTNNTNLTSAEF